LALNLLAAAAFISSHSFVGGTPQASALRGFHVASAAGNGHELEFQPFSSENVQSSQTFSWKPMVAFVATVGLVASMSSAPVNAQTLPTKEERLAAAKVKEAEELAKIDAQELKGDSVSQGLGKSKKKKVVELKKPEKKAEAAPAAAPAAEAPKVSSVAAPVLASADEPVSKYYDPDEDLTWIIAPNPIYFALVSGIMPVTFLFFYILGSLNVI